MDLELSKPYKAEKLLAADNAAELIAKADLAKIGHSAVQEFEIDDISREPWKEKYLQAAKLALQIWERKTTPWEGASNVKFPLLTIAALQFQARAYPALVTRPDLVKAAVFGNDAQGLKTAEAERVSTFMSYQLLVQDEHWEEDTDRLLLMLPIVGFVIRKTFYDTVRSRNCSELLLPEDFCVSYFTKNLESCPRATAILHESYRDIKNKQRQGLYLDNVEVYKSRSTPPVSKSEELRRARGFIEPQEDPDATRDVLEQHTYLDLDGDGYAEPVIVTVDRCSCKVLRLVMNYIPEDVVYDTSKQITQLTNQATQIQSQPLPTNVDPSVVRQEISMRRSLIESIGQQIEQLRSQAKVTHIEAVQYFTKYPFIPAPDGSFYDIGFGHILSPVNAAVDTLINQLIDSGTLQNSNVGFISSNARMRGADFRFRPYEYKRTEVPIGSLKDSILPLPINAPSPVLFELLKMLVQYGERTASISDIMVGDTPGQNTPAETSRTALDQGLKVYTGIQLRLYRAFTSEYRKLYKLNRIYLDPQQYFSVLGTGNPAQVYQQDFLGDPSAITPQADPTMGSQSERVNRANMVLGLAKTVPGFNLPFVVNWVLQELKIPNIQQIYTGAPAPMNPEIQLKAADIHRRTIEAQTKGHAQLIAAISKIRLEEAQATLALAQATALGDQTAIATANQQLEAFKGIHSSMMDLQRVVNESAQAQSDIELNQSVQRQQQQVANDKQAAPAAAQGAEGSSAGSGNMGS